MDGCPHPARKTLGLGGAVFLVKPYGDDGCRVVPLHSSNRQHKSLGGLVGRANNHGVKTQQKPEVKAGDVISVVQMNHGTGHPPSVPVLGAVRVYEPNVKANTLRWCVAIAAHRQKGLVPGQSAPPHRSCPA